MVSVRLVCVLVRARKHFYIYYLLIAEIVYRTKTNESERESVGPIMTTRCIIVNRVERERRIEHALSLAKVKVSLAASRPPRATDRVND